MLQPMSEEILGRLFRARAAAAGLLAAGGLALAGCMSWAPGWEGAPTAPVGRPGDAAAAVGGADDLFREATDEARLRQAIAAYEEALAVLPRGPGGELPPATVRPLAALAEAHVLHGAAWAGGRAAKARSYRAGIRAAEAAMALTPGFRRRVAAGATVAEAAGELGPEQMRSMLFWVTGVSYYFKECLWGPSHLWNFRWMLRTREVMERMTAVDPGFEHGAVPFSLAIYFIGLPAGAGRDLTRAGELLAQAEAEAPGSLLVPWGRAKYLHSRTGDLGARRRDLARVLAADPRRAESPLPWNVYFQRDAAAMLSRLEPPL